MMNKYILGWQDSGKNNGGLKAKSDVEYILSKKDFKIIPGPKSKLTKLLYPYILNYKSKALENSVVLIQYPTAKAFQRNAILRGIRKGKNIKIIFLIHDIDALRFINDNNQENKIKDEINILNQADGLIVLNDILLKKLELLGIDKPMVSMGIWDYLNPVSLKEKVKYEEKVCYAGNLLKAKFLSKYNQKHLLNVFGPNSSNMSKSVIYHGQFSPNELPAQLNYNFGLVWDGDSVDTCSGDYGMYLKYNDPHKVSLYISSGLPVIIWKEAAVAKFIQQHHAGILIESLSEIDKVLSKISQDDYYQMRMNTLKLARLMRKGYFLDKSVNKLLNLMKVSGE